MLKVLFVAYLDGPPILPHWRTGYYLLICIFWTKNGQMAKHLKTLYSYLTYFTDFTWDVLRIVGRFRSNVFLSFTVNSALDFYPT